MPNPFQQSEKDGQVVEELVIPLPNGNTLRCGQGTEYQWGGYVRLCNPKGEELAYWDCAEWEEDPEFVMGAIFGQALNIA